MLIRTLLFSVLIVAGDSLAVSGRQEREVNLKVQITTSDNADLSPKTQYSAGEKVLIRVSMTNESADEVIITVGQQWRYIRPRLERNGELVAYKEERQNLLKEGSPLYSPVIIVRLKPNTPSGTDELNLDEWYDGLGPGHYRLSVGRSWKGQDLISNTVEFDVIP